MSETAQAEAQSTPPAEGTAPATPPQEGAAAPATAAPEGQTATNGDEKRQVAGLYISTPEVLRLRIEEEAGKVSKTPRVFVRDCGRTCGSDAPRAAYSQQLRNSGRAREGAAGEAQGACRSHQAASAGASRQAAVGYGHRSVQR